MGHCTFCSDAAFVALIVFFYLLWLYKYIWHLNFCRHILWQHSSSFPQHKEKTKIIQPENCTDGTKSLHKHGRPEVSCSHFTITSLCFTFCLLIQILICSPGSLFVCRWIPQRSIYIFHLCARGGKTSGHSQAVWAQEHTSEESHLVCNTEQHKGESLRKKNERAVSWP